jgi:hypothetical protein
MASAAGAGPFAHTATTASSRQCIAQILTVCPLVLLNAANTQLTLHIIITQKSLQDMSPAERLSQTQLMS